MECSGWGSGLVCGSHGWVGEVDGEGWRGVGADSLADAAVVIDMAWGPAAGGDARAVGARGRVVAGESPADVIQHRG